MSHLLDTHAFVWAAFEPRRLGPEAVRLLEDKSNKVFVSSVGLWEIALKYALGKLVLKNCKPDDLLRETHRLDLEILELSGADAATSHRLPRLSHRDPFDRMIVWQAIRQNFTLVTKDRGLEAYQSLGLKMIW